MMNNQSKELIEKLNSYQFYDNNGVLMGDVLHYDIELCEDVSLKIGIKSLLKSFLIMLTENYIYNFKGENIDTCVIYTIGCGVRRDHIKSYNDAVDIIDNCMKVNIGKRRLSLRKLKMVPRYFQWIRDLKKIGVRGNQRLYLARTILQAYSSYESVCYNVLKKNIDIKNIVVYCDVMADDCMIVQKMNQRGIQTVTLCHASYNINLDSWPYKGAHSKYILVHSERARQDAIKAECKANILVSGDPNNIVRTANNYNASKSIINVGLILNSQVAGEVNKYMIEMMQKYARENGKRLLIKLHPSNDAQEINSYIDNEVAFTYGGTVSIPEFAKQIDLAIISNSNVFYEMLFLNKPVLISAIKVDYHSYDEYDCFKFKNYNELVELIKMISSDKYYKNYQECRNYFIGSGDIKNQHKECYGMIGIC